MPYNSYSEKAFSLEIFSTPRHRSDTKYTVMMTKEKFAKIVNFMTPEEGVMIGCGHKSQIVTWLRQTKCIVIITKEEYTKIVNFITPWAGVLVLGRGHMSYSENALLFLKKILYSGARFRQSKCIVMMTTEGSTKIVNFITPGAGVLVLSVVI